MSTSTSTMIPVRTAVQNFVDDFFERHAERISPNGPELDSFVPNQEALLGGLWRNDIGKVPNKDVVDVTSSQQGGSTSTSSGFLEGGRANLLLYGLDDTSNKLSQPEADKYIHQAKNCTPSFLYGVSGAGKTRTILEHLSRNKGFYFLAHDPVNNPGSRDVLSLLREFKKCNNVKISEKGDDKDDSDANREFVEERISWLLFIRLAVHQKLTTYLKKDLTAYEWLLYQLYPDRFFGDDIFQSAFETVVLGVENKQVAGSDVTFASSGLENGEKWSIFVDEAQKLTEKFTNKFLDTTKGDTKRSAFSAVMGGFSNICGDSGKFYFPVFSGTGLSFDQLTEEASSVTGKNMDADHVSICFARFELLQTNDVQEYLGQFLDLSRISDDVRQHVAEWLRGRPRSTASFLEVYIRRKEKDNYKAKEWRTRTDKTLCSEESTLIQALDRYLNVVTLKDDEQRRESWSPGNKSMYANFDRLKTKIGNSETYRGVLNTLEQAIYNLVVGSKPAVFAEPYSRHLIENGIAAVCKSATSGDVVLGYIDEPIVVEAGRNFFNIDRYLMENLTRQETDGQGQAFEKLLLPGLMMEKSRLMDFLRSHLEVHEVQRLNGFEIPRKSAYGVLCVDTSPQLSGDDEECDETGDAKSRFQKTIDWLAKSLNVRFEGQVPPFCYPDNYIGPDILFLLRGISDFSDRLGCVVQSKYEVDVNNQQKALRTLAPDMMYHTKRGKPEMKSILSSDEIDQFNKCRDDLISDSHPCLRLLVQFPADTTSSAVSGMVPKSGTGPTSNTGKAPRDWMIVVSGNDIDQLFEPRSADVVKLLKRKREKI